MLLKRKIFVFVTGTLFNPILKRFYRYLDLKSKQSDADVPPLDPALKRITEPDPDLLSLQLPLLENLSKSFELRENPKVGSRFLSPFTVD
jgi:hypothetical protein